jgi:hypothetical protein
MVRRWYKTVQGTFDRNRRHHAISRSRGTGSVWSIGIDLQTNLLDTVTGDACLLFFSSMGCVLSTTVCTLGPGKEVAQ